VESRSGEEWSEVDEKEEANDDDDGSNGAFDFSFEGSFLDDLE
jgi:hypothetical protein